MFIQLLILIMITNILIFLKVKNLLFPNSFHSKLASSFLING